MGDLIHLKTDVMLKIKNFRVLFITLLSSTAFAQYTDLINSNRPGKSMSAFSVGKTVIQAEGGIYGIQEKHDLLRYEANGFGTELSVRYGAFFDQFEFNLESQYQYDWYKAPLVNDTRGGFKQMTFGAKYLVFDPFLKLKDDKPNVYSWKANHRFKWRQLIPALAGYAGVNFGIGDNPFNYAPSNIEEPSFSPKATIIAQNQFGSRWVLVTNISYDKIGTDFASINYILTLTRGFNSQWSGFFENQGYNGDYYSDGVFRIGAAYLFHKNMQLDASLGKNVKGTPSIMNASVGFSWRFADKYEEVKIEKDNGSKMDKKMKKKADKEKKRKDQVDIEE